MRLAAGDGFAAIPWVPRVARESDVPALEELIPRSVRVLQAGQYSIAQMEAALGPVFGVDRQLIRDGTYRVVEQAGMVVGGGGWSRRRSLFGGDGHRAGDDGLLDVRRDAARIRAFFVHPAWARRGIASAILAACEQAAREAGFATAELVATLAGEPFYAARGYGVVGRHELPLVGGVALPVVRMMRRLADAADGGPGRVP